MPEVGQMHLEVPWESLFGLKMKIYVELPHSEQFQLYLAHVRHLACLAQGRMDQESQGMTFWDPFRSHHVCLSVVLVYQDFCTFWAQPNVHLSSFRG